MNTIDILFEEAAVERFEQMFQNGEYDFTYCSELGLNVLHYTALTGNLERVKELLELGVDINAKGINGMTLLHSAALSGNLEIVQWLVEQGLDVNARIIVGSTALHYAALSGSL